MEQGLTPERQSGTGYLVVQVTTASSAIPLEGAAVRISRDETSAEALLFELRTARDGRTERVTLPAPVRTTSLTPNTEAVFSAYNIEVSAPGYTSVVYNHVPIFDGITAIQQANLTPLPEAGYPDDFTKDDPRLFDEEINFGL